MQFYTINLQEVSTYISEMYYEIFPHNDQINLHRLQLCFQTEQNNTL